MTKDISGKVDLNPVRLVNFVINYYNKRKSIREYVESPTVSGGEIIVTGPTSFTIRVRVQVGIVVSALTTTFMNESGK